MADEMEMVDEAKEQSLMDELAHSETVRKLIECPVCLELPLPPIYVCNKGHIVCNNCQARTYACPLCREHYSTTRGFVAEGIIEKCILRCKHSDNGCPLSMRGSALVDHLEVCDYRPVKCIDCTNTIVNFDEYEDHLLNFHKIHGSNEGRAFVLYSMNLTHQIAFGEKCFWPQYFLKGFNDDVTFLLRMYATHWFVCAWVCLLGAKSDCSKYMALLEFRPENDTTMMHTWQGPVNHFRDDPAKGIFLKGKGLITPMETLMQISRVVDDHAEWLYNVEIYEASKSEWDKFSKDPESSETAAGGPPTLDEGKDKEQQVPSTSPTLPTEVVTCRSARTDGDGSLPPPASPSACCANQISTAETTGPSDGNTSLRCCRRFQSSTRLLSADTTRLLCSTGSAPSCPPLRTPRRPLTSLASRGIHTSAIASIHPSTSGTNNVLTPGPAVMSPSSTSMLAQAATVTSFVPTQTLLMNQANNNTMNSQANANNLPSSSMPYQMPSYNSEQSQGPNRTLRPSARFLNSIRRSSSTTLSDLAPLGFYLRGSQNRANYGMAEDDWNGFTSDSDEE